MRRPDPRLADPARCLVLDGGTGTELRRRGAALDPVAWSAPACLTAYDTLVRIHRDYLAAGADVVTTNTFAAARFVLEAAGLHGAVAAVARRAVAAAFEARESDASPALVAGSMSCFPPAFDVNRYPDPASESAAYRELASALAEGGVDLLIVEMIEDTVHARRACEAAVGTGLPVWIGVSARRAEAGRDALVAYDFPDTPFEHVVDALVDLAPAAFMIMHTPLDATDLALRTLAARWTGPYGAYPEIDGTPPAAFVNAVHDWRQHGARVLGGCCGTTPRHIAALRGALDD